MDAKQTSSVFARLLLIGVVVFGPVAWVGCDSGSGMDGETVPDQVSYELTAVSNDGAAPEGVEGTVTFWRLGPDTTLVTLDLDADATVPETSHPAHIHANSASEGGGVEFYLAAVNGSSPTGTSARKIGQPIDVFLDFDGHVNVHESPAALETIVSQGDIGTNAETATRDETDQVDDPRNVSYSLQASPTDGSVFPDGVSGSVTIQEVTSTQTLVTYSLDVSGSVNAANEGDVTVAPIAHIHENNVSEGGAVTTSPFSGYLGSIAPTDPDARSGRLLDVSYDDLTSYDGYVNVHESNADAQFVFSEGNIGANASPESGSEADVTVTMDNKGTSAWEVTDVSGASGVAQTGTENPDLTLEVGTRYRFDNNGGGTHPLAFQNANADDLLRQDGEGSLEDDGDINYQEDQEGVTFTYTQSLADAVASYRCTNHSSMNGTVETK